MSVLKPLKNDFPLQFIYYVFLNIGMKSMNYSTSIFEESNIFFLSAEFYQFHKGNILLGRAGKGRMKETRTYKVKELGSRYNDKGNTVTQTFTFNTSIGRHQKLHQKPIIPGSGNRLRRVKNKAVMHHSGLTSRKQGKLFYLNRKRIY